MIQLETYRGTKTRHTCPSCGTRLCFVRYVAEDGSYFAPNVGRCNRESKCGYHYTPKQYFADNSQEKPKGKSGAAKSKSRPTNYGFANPVSNEAKVATSTNAAAHAFKSTDYIPQEHLLSTLGGYENNAFVQFLLNLFPDDADAMWSTIKSYFVGTYSHYQGAYTSFPYIDTKRRIERDKLIRFNPDTGKRLKGNYDTGSLSAMLKKAGKLREDFTLGNCFFGEHLLSLGTEKAVGIVEAEKTAVIASICLPELIWLACGSKTSLKPERLKRLGEEREIILYPDADGYALWKEIALAARRNGQIVKASSLIETSGTEDEKRDGYDLADYLINQQKRINALNEATDAYNQKLDQVLSTPELMNYFSETYAERCAIMGLDELPDSEVRQIVRRIV